MIKPINLRASVLGVSVWGPGLEGWAASRPILAGDMPYAPRSSPPAAPSLLAATERRRSGPVVRLALAVAHEAALQSGIEMDRLRAVFGSSNGDGPVIGGILDALAAGGADGERVVSPTQFHNSVHNAAAGYWSIGTGSRQPATCIGCHDDTWAAALLTAMVELGGTGEPVLLCCYDHPLPPPLEAMRPTGPAFGVALVLGPARAGPILSVAHVPCPARPGAALAPGLRAIEAANPAARALPLLAALAAARPEVQALPYLDGHLHLELLP